jgi:hypothetical protein
MNTEKLKEYLMSFVKWLDYLVTRHTAATIVTAIIFGIIMGILL